MYFMTTRLLCACIAPRSATPAVPRTLSHGHAPFQILSGLARSRRPTHALTHSTWTNDWQFNYTEYKTVKWPRFRRGLGGKSRLDVWRPLPLAGLGAQKTEPDSRSWTIGGRGRGEGGVVIVDRRVAKHPKE